jgi:hypothetical protein
VPKNPRFQQRYASMIYFYAVRFALQQAMQQQGGFANLLFFYSPIFEMLLQT